MKKNNIIRVFLAQRLDNREIDHIELDGYLLNEMDVNDREAVDLKISEISMNGVQIFTENSHTASVRKDMFLLKTPSDQLDNAGRIAPIITYGHIPDKISSSWSSDVLNSLTKFAGRIDRTISKKNMEIAQRAMQYVIAKTSRDRIFRNSIWTGFGIIIIAIIYWILFSD